MHGPGSHGRRLLSYSIVSATGFTLLVAWIIFSNAGLAYYIYVLPVAYLATFAVLASFIASSRKTLRLITAMLVGAALITGVTVAATASHGYPVGYSAQGFNTSCTQVKVQNATSPLGYTNSTLCSSTPTSSSSVQSLGLDFLYWLPVSGLVLSAVTAYRREQSTSERTGYAVFSLILLVALLLPISGLLPVAGS